MPPDAVTIVIEGSAGRDFVAHAGVLRFGGGCAGNGAGHAAPADWTAMRLVV